MNGRCETDPLDRAVDVCDSCYGEFCAECLVHPKGRRHPICSECALIAAGVRAGAQPERLGSRRSAKKRRAALKEQAANEPKLFEYFDAVPSDDVPSEADPADGEELAAEASEPEPVEETDQVDTEPEPDLAPVDDLAANEPEEEPTSPTGVEPATPAVARLNQIRETERRGQPPEPDPVSEPLSEPELAAVAKSTVVREPDSADQAESPGPVIKPEPPVAAPRRRRTDLIDGDVEPPATAPMIGEIRVIGGRRSTDVAEPEPESDPVAPEPVAVAGSRPPNAVDQFDAGGRDAATSSTKADTDASGNWIPPILRGMAPDAREAKASLPQRRKRED